MAAAEALGARTMHLEDQQETVQPRTEPPAPDPAQAEGNSWIKTEGTWI